MNKNLLTLHDLWYASRGSNEPESNNHTESFWTDRILSTDYLDIPMVSLNGAKRHWLVNLSYWNDSLICGHAYASYYIERIHETSKYAWAGLDHRERQKSIFLHLNGLSFLALTVTKSICYF